MIERVLEPEVMDTPDEARDYDEMDHSQVNHVFAADFLSAFPDFQNTVLDVGTGTALIPIELCRQSSRIELLGIDLAEEMLIRARANIERASFTDRIRVECVNARELPYRDAQFGSVISNSIIHHIPNPIDCLREIVRLCRPGGGIFVRDLLRPDSLSELDRLVNLYSAGANTHQRTLFAQSLHAALTVDEMRALVASLGFPPDSVQQTTDRHWTLAVRNHAP